MRPSHYQKAESERVDRCTLAIGTSMAKQILQRPRPMKADMMSAFNASSSAASMMSYRVSIDLHETNVNGRITYWVSRQSPVYFNILRQLRHLTWASWNKMTSIYLVNSFILYLMGLKSIWRAGEQFYTPENHIYFWIWHHILPANLVRGGFG